MRGISSIFLAPLTLHTVARHLCSMSPRRQIAAVLLVGFAVAVVPAVAGATSLYTNAVNTITGTTLPTPWTQASADGLTFASSQGVTLLQNGLGPAVHAHGFGGFADAQLRIEFMLQRPLGGNIPVTLTGQSIVEVFGQGSARFDGVICSGLANACVVNPTILVTLPSDAIVSNLSPTNTSRVDTYIVNTMLPANTWMTLRLHAQASAQVASNTRAFLDPVFAIGDPSTTLVFANGLQINNNFIPPPSVPEPASAALLAIGAAALAVRRRA